MTGTRLIPIDDIAGSGKSTTITSLALGRSGRYPCRRYSSMDPPDNGMIINDSWQVSLESATEHGLLGTARALASTAGNTGTRRPDEPSLAPSGWTGTSRLLR